MKDEKKPDNALALLAVWSYDLYPYAICGEVERFNENGNPVIKGMQGRAFITRTLLPLQPTGEAFRNELRSLSADYRQAKEAFDKEWDDKQQALLTKYGIKAL